MSSLLLQLMLVPFLACVVLVLIHSYLGIHVLARGVIFVDIALAQIAALGTTVALLLGFDSHSGGAYVCSLAFTFVGAAIFAISRNLRERVPQEAFIGITYAVASAAAIVVIDMSDAGHGADQIKQLLVGDLLTVTASHVAITAAIYAVVGAFHFAFRRKFLAISFEPESAEAKAGSAIGWDLAFYMSFGFVITSSVHIAGVLLVFSFLVVPAVFAAMFSNRLLSRLLLSWVFGIGVAGAGALGSLQLDLPPGATIVVAFGIALLIAAIVRALMTRLGGAQAIALSPTRHE